MKGDHLDEDQLAAAVATTIRHYDDKAAAFWAGTHDHDVTQNLRALLRHIGGAAPFRILDLGCGPGRDLATLRDMGHQPIGLDAAARFCVMAREWSGCEVWRQDMLAMELPTDYFDGVFANAVLFHVPTQELPRVLKELWTSLKARGVLFSSNPRGQNEEGWQGDRYGVFHDREQWSRYVTAAGFEELEHYYRPPGQPRHRQPWLATVWRKLDQTERGDRP